jgi:hypothetical protein
VSATKGDSRLWNLALTLGVTGKGFKMNRKQFWLRYLGALALYFIGLVAFDAITGQRHEGIELMALVLTLVAQFRTIYLRAIDVGYDRPGWMTAAVLLPFIGLLALLSIGFLPTGARSGCRLPVLATAWTDPKCASPSWRGASDRKAVSADGQNSKAKENEMVRKSYTRASKRTVKTKGGFRTVSVKKYSSRIGMKLRRK